MNKLKLSVIIIVGVLAWHFTAINLPVKGESQPIISFSHTISAQAADVSYVTKVLRRDPSATSNNFLSTFYSFSRGLLNLALFVFLVYVAFRNILNWNVETYSIKKMLPRVVFAAFFGNLLLPILSVASALIDQLQSSVAIFDYPGSWSWWTMVHGGGLAMVEATSIIIGYLLPGISAFMFLLPIIMELFLIGGLLMLGLFDSLRGYIVFLAAGLGPIAVGLSIFPETESFYKKWGKILFFWMVYPLLIGLIYYLAKNVPKMSGIRGDGILASTIGLFIPMLVKIGLFSVAVRAPFTWEKDVSGLVAALPGQAKGGFDKGRGFIDTYGKKGVRMAYDAKSQLKKNVSNELANKQKNHVFKNEANARLGTAEGQADVQKAKIEILRGRLDNNTAQNMFQKNANEVTKEEFAQMYERYSNGTLDTDHVEGHRYADRFFSGEDAAATQKAEAQIRPKYEADAESAAKKEAIKNMEEDWRYNLYEGIEGSAWSPFATFGGLAAGYRISQEVTAKEDEKAIKRKSVAYKKTSSRMARGKSEQERLASDMAMSEKSEELAEEYSKILQALYNGAYEAVTNVDDSEEERAHQAREWVMQNAHKLRVSGDNIVGWDLAFDPIREAIEAQNENFENIMNHASVLFPRLSVLISREARSPKRLEEQQQIIDEGTHKIFQTYAGGPPGSPGGAGPAPGAPSGPSGAGPRPGGSPSGPSSGGRPPLMPSPSGDNSEDTSEALEEIAANISTVTNELKAVDRSVNGVRSQIRVTTGPPLDRMNKLISRQSLTGITGEDIEELSQDTEMGLAEVSDILTRKAPGKEAEVRQFVQDLDASKGLSLPEMISRAQQEFYPGETIDPSLEEKMADIASNQVVSMEATKQSDDNKVLIDRAGQFVLNENISPRIVNELEQSIDVFNTHNTAVASGQQSPVSPQSLQGAKQVIASHSGLSDGNAVTQSMVDNMTRVLSASIVRDPITDNRANRPTNLR